MTKKGNLWQASIELPRGKHEYRFVIDGEWIADPRAQESVPNPFGGVNSVVCI